MESMDQFSEAISKMDFDFFSQGKHKIMPEDFFKTKDIVFLDVRTPIETQMLHFPLEHHGNTLHIPLHELPSRYQEIPKDKTVAIFCSGTQRASIAFGYLRGLGYENVRILLAPIDTFASHFKPGNIRKIISK